MTIFNYRKQSLINKVKTYPLIKTFGDFKIEPMKIELVFLSEEALKEFYQIHRHRWALRNIVYVNKKYLC